MENQRRVALAVTGLALLLTLWSQPITAQNKVAFATSVAGNGNLGDPAQWPDNGGLTGIAAADKICQNRATAAGLANPTDFVAWISDASDDAYCRVHDLNGQRAANCGQATLPIWAGPWVRTDGSHFAAPIHLALGISGQIFNPVALDEYGVEVSPYRGIFTAADTDGVYDPGFDACAGWSDGTTGYVTLGHARGTSVRWTDGATGGCELDRSLLCLEAGGPGAALTTPMANGAQVFITSVTGTADLGSWPQAGGLTGIAAGNKICETLASNAGLHAPSSFKAWLSDSTADARDRFPTDGPWVRLDGVMVSQNMSALIDSVIDSSISLTETGVYLGDSAFTGSTYLGAAHDTCTDWTDGSTGQADAGSSGMTNTQWTGGYTSCTGPAHLYCFSDTDTWHAFSDGFESGTTGAWDAAVP